MKLLIIKKYNARECRWYLRELADQLTENGITIKKLNTNSLELRTTKVHVKLYPSSSNQWMGLSSDADYGFDPDELRHGGNPINDPLVYIMSIEEGE